MTTPKWQPGKLYPPGSLVVPRTDQSTAPPAVSNGGFESGAAGWTFSGGAAYVPTGGFGGGAGCVRLPGNVANGLALNDSVLEVSVGGSITASAMIQQGASVAGATAGWVEVQWFDADNALVKTSTGNVVNSGSGGAWRQSRVVSPRPGGAVYARAGIRLTSVADHSHPIWGDTLVVSGTSVVATALQYKAVQPATGYSNTEEPSWPPMLGQTVIDNEVIWEAVSISRVVWQARPILKSGPTEPDWPEQHGAFVADNTISWEAVDLRITDPNCPNSKVVAIAKSKIYAGDRDVVRYSATLNPRDWTSMEDAGYIGTGLQQNGANEVAVLNLYRGNLIVMNAPMFQQWNIDPDPALMDLLDTMEGIGSIWHLAAQPVANDLFYLSALGVRTIGLSGATNNLKSGDVGLPVDPMVQLLVREAQELGEQPLGMYYPASGQYWLIFNRLAEDDGSGVSPMDVCPTLKEGDRYAEVMVYTLNQIGQVGAWTRYVFPFAIDYTAMYGDDLFVRDGDTVYRLSEMIGACDFFDDTPPGQ